MHSEDWEGTFIMMDIPMRFAAMLDSVRDTFRECSMALSDSRRSRCSRYCMLVDKRQITLHESGERCPTASGWTYPMLHLPPRHDN